MHLKHQCTLQPSCPFWPPSDFKCGNRSGYTTCLLDQLRETLCWRASKLSNSPKSQNIRERKKYIQFHLKISQWFKVKSAETIISTLQKAGHCLVIANSPCLSAEISNSLVHHQWIQVALLWPSSSPSQALKLQFHFCHSKDSVVRRYEGLCGKAWCQNVSSAGRAVICI